MAICVTTNVVCMGGGYFKQVPTGVEFTGCAVAFQFVDCSKSPVQGETCGYQSGGLCAPGAVCGRIDRFPFASDDNSTNVGNLTGKCSFAAGQSSSTHGYASGGRYASGPTRLNTIDKYQFGSEIPAIDVGSMSQSRHSGAGQSSLENGYTSGGNAPPFVSPQDVDRIDKFPFATDANATDIGNLVLGRQAAAGQSSTESGYTSGGESPSQKVACIDKYPFASDTNATAIPGTLTCSREASGISSLENGYSTAGMTGPPFSAVNIIDKFPFAAETNATDVGDLSQDRRDSGGTGSRDNGYSAGGSASGPTIVDTIDKFPFATDTNATDVGEMTQARRGARATQQV